MAQVRSKKSPRPAAPKRGAGSARPAGPKPRKVAASGGGLLASAKVLARHVALGVLLGGLVGGGTVAFVARRAALERVDHRLGHEVWSVPGRIYSGPIEVWIGLTQSPEELAEDLVAAGYARATSTAAAGDFTVAADRIVVHTRAEKGPGYSVAEGTLTIRFADGRVSGLSSGRRATLPPATFALVKGAENENRSPVALSEMPEQLRSAVVSMEDARFYDHMGIDPLGLARAMVANAQAGAWVQGGSTLTQQLAKNLFLSTERTASRKFDELFLAMALEERLSKDEILTLYLNEIYLGQADGSAVCGMDAAAHAYFSRPVGKLTLPQSATLAGIISAPNQYSPVRHPEVAVERRNLALRRMVETGRLKAPEAAIAEQAPLGVESGPGSRRAPWAMDLALDQAEHEVGDGAVVKGALRVYTSIHPALQRLAERIVQEGGASLEKEYPRLKGVQVALAAVRIKDGAIVAMVGGRDYLDSPYNRAWLSSRLIGSTVKPLTALAAFEADPSLSPATLFDDAPIHRVTDGRDWEPANYDRTFVGPISLRRAIATSRNIPAVLLAERVGMGSLKRTWQALGLSDATDWPSAALGGFGATPVELAGAYTVFAGGGHVRKPWVTRSVIGGKGEDLWERKAPETASWSPRAAGLALDLLREVLRTGTGKSAAKYGVGAAAGGKSGTTDDTTDAWFVGVTPELAVAVWVGNDHSEKLGLTGSAAALPMWARFVAATGTSEGDFARPSGVESVEVCDETGAPPCGGAACASSHVELFSAGHVPVCGAVPSATASAPDEEPGVSVEERTRTIGDHWRRLGELLGVKR